MDTDHNEKPKEFQAGDQGVLCLSKPSYASGESTLCCQCNKYFSSVGNLNKHLKNVHKIAVNPAGEIKCLEYQCSFSCKEISSLRNHLMQQHGMKMEMEKVKFNSYKGN